ncbi:MAG: helix-turn-helix transcriptional regulator [Saprospiraceae bacterium]
MSISERIGLICEFEGSQKKFSEKTGIKQQTVSGMVSRQANIRSDNIIAIAEAYPNLSMEWLITGQGEMWKPEKEDERIEPMEDTEKELLKDEVISLLKKQIRMMTQAILEKSPELAEYLRLEEED